LKTEDLLTLVNSGFLREKEMDLWRVTTRDPYLMEKHPDESADLHSLRMTSSRGCSDTM
jgi:hypothetical protein